jgi:cobalamin biosynthesis protein CbiG
MEWDAAFTQDYRDKIQDTPVLIIVMKATIRVRRIASLINFFGP